MGKLNIKNGTPVGSESLCRTCSYAHIMTGYRESELITMCTEVHPNIVLPFQIHECSGYYDKQKPTWEQMKKFAIDISPGSSKPVGFKAGLGFQDSRKLVRVHDEDEEGDDESPKTVQRSEEQGSGVVVGEERRGPLTPQS